MSKSMNKSARVVTRQYYGANWALCSNTINVTSAATVDAQRAGRAPPNVAPQPDLPCAICCG